MSDEEQETRPRYVAHTPREGTKLWQSMEGHVVGDGKTPGVVPLAEKFADAFGAAEWGRWAGLLHDIGKYSDEFQQKLDNAWEAKKAKKPEPKERVDHKSAGARLAREFWGERRETRPASAAMAAVLYGHHGGVPNVSKLQNDLIEANRNASFSAAIRTAREEMAVLGAPPDLAPPDWVKTPIEMELFIRMLYSCLVDADSLDTEAHFNPEKSEARTGSVPLCVYREELERKQRELMDEVRKKAPLSEVNEVRREVYEACLSAAEKGPGVFRLTVPTGGGKTRSSLAFALEHACRYGMERVIYAIPYTSIIDQTVAEFRKIFGEGGGDPRVLEHHSAVPEPKKTDGAEANAVEGAELWRRLASENWDAPLVVTTTVQLFESLFGNRPGRSRKVHRLARSVIVLDEVQTLPPPLLAPILDALKALATHYHATVVLCTATQPALEIDSPYLKGFEEGKVRDIVEPEAYRRHFRQLQRVEYRIEREPWDWKRVAQEMQTPQCMAVVNTRKDALALLKALEEEGATDLLHLSTLLCGKHRRDVIEEVKRRLTAGEPVRLVSTQVVEAGVDLDFPKVLRAMGPLDRIIQAAGRCNREGKLREGDELVKGEVIVFTPEEGGSPQGPYAAATGQTKVVLGREEVDLHNPDTIEGFFRSFYRLVNTDERKIMSDRITLDFPAVAESFRMIEEDTVAVLAPYDKVLYDRIIEEAYDLGRMTRELWREAQPLMVSMYRPEFSKLKASVIDVVIPDQLYVWRGEYNELRGLSGVARDPSDLIS